MRLTEAEIEKIISEKIFGLTLKKISSANEELIDSGTLSSITMVELAVELEKAFSISLSFMEVSKENFRNVAALKRLLLQKLV